VRANISPPAPEREFRGAWVATVNNIDWPSRPGLPPAQQQRELLGILDHCQRLKLNVVILQVRPACDALYPSSLEPWSEYLTGAQGKAPAPSWDPLAFAVTQAHARGLELHAWFNPFRARHGTGFSRAATNHISNTQPSIVRRYGRQLWLDPGLQATHDYSARVILDVVQRYDIDGIHIDDYFYPYPEKDAEKKDIPFPDWASWQNYQRSGGTLSRDDWRRDNVSRFIARMYREVKAARPWIKVGISPFGIYRPGHPQQIKGFDQYESLYADPRTWLAKGTLDYLAPQLYWRIDAPEQSFPVLLKWWTENNPQKRMIVPGLNTTGIGPLRNNTTTNTNRTGWPTSEIERQIQLTRQQPGAAGHIHWNMSALMRNKGGVNEALSRGEYDRTALVPALDNTSRLPAPALSARVTQQGVEFHCDVPPTSPARFLLVQHRRDDGTWHMRVLPGKSFTEEHKFRPSAIAMRLVDKFGQPSDPAVLTRAAQ
jgi:uncharacterized lipoprotein YddW (UPF0748 family)